MSQKNYIIASTKPWHAAAFEQHRQNLPGQWVYISSPENLTLEFLNSVEPRYVFFPHWSWRVPSSILTAYECVCFHMTDVPYGRGGSPLQNLILRGHEDTVLTALRMSDQLDAGPVYLKRPLSLAGSAQRIFERAATLTIEMMTDIVVNNPKPVDQVGEVTVFSRRTPLDSLLPRDGSLREIFDFIRMLDAETYPKAFLEWGNFELTFERAAQVDQRHLEATVRIRLKEPK